MIKCRRIVAVMVGAFALVMAPVAFSATVSQWTMEGSGTAGIGSTVPDVVGTNDGSIVEGAQEYVDGALLLDGTGYVSVSNDASLQFDLSTDDFTMEVVFRTDKVGELAFFTNAFGGGDSEYWARTTNDGVILAIVRGDDLAAPERIIGPGTTTVNDGAWHHFALVYSSTSEVVSMYIDGALETTTAVPAADGVIGLGLPGLVIGAAEGDGWWERGFRGEIADVRFSDEALDTVDFLAVPGPGATISHWTMAGSGTALIGDTVADVIGGNDGTVAESDLEYVGTPALRFDGTGFLRVVDDPSLDFDLSAGDFTMEAVFKTNVTGELAFWGNAFGGGDSEYWARTTNDGVILAVVRGDDPGAPERVIGPGTTTVNDGAWHHFALVYRLADEEITMYVDGVEETTTTVAAADGVIGVGLPGPTIGVVEGDGWFERQFEGDIADVRFSAAALDAGEFLTVPGGGGGGGCFYQAPNWDLEPGATPNYVGGHAGTTHSIIEDDWAGEGSTGSLQASVVVDERVEFHLNQPGIPVDIGFDANYFNFYVKVIDGTWRDATNSATTSPRLQLVTAAAPWESLVNAFEYPTPEEGWVYISIDTSSWPTPPDWTTFETVLVENYTTGGTTGTILFDHFTLTCTPEDGMLAPPIFPPGSTLPAVGGLGLAALASVISLGGLVALRRRRQR